MTTIIGGCTRALLRDLLLSSSLLASVLSASAQSRFPETPPDVVLSIRTTQVVADEVRRMCLTRYPELQEEVDTAYRSWSLFPIKITIIVNGKEYEGPRLETVRRTVRELLNRQDSERSRRDCEEFGKRLVALTEQHPQEALAKFLLWAHE